MQRKNIGVLISTTVITDVSVSKLTTMEQGVTTAQEKDMAT